VHPDDREDQRSPIREGCTALRQKPLSWHARIPWQTVSQFILTAAKPKNRRAGVGPTDESHFSFVRRRQPLEERMSTRAPPIVWYIVLAPFATLVLLGLGSLEGLWFLFFAHLILLATTLIPSFQGFGPVMTFFGQADNEVWLTIDDGPDPRTTPAILDLLDRFDAKATFFLVGQKIMDAPDLAQMILDRGHSIGNHTQTHPQLHFWRLGPRRLRHEIERFEETLANLNLPIPCFFRAPTGMKNPYLHPILSARSLFLVGWSARAFDTRVKEPVTAAERLLRTVEPGAILLLHECSQISIRTLEILLRALDGRQIRCVIPKPDQLRTKRTDSVKTLDCEPSCATFSKWGSITQSWRRLYRKDSR
jgi:peptidoglycan/xylan/chitin deacetylase (PgdA/CDA1 family)